MNKWILFLIPFLMAFTPIFSTHDTPEKVTDEFRNLENSSQPKQWRVFPGTPTLTDLEPNEVVIVSTNGVHALMWRDNVEIYSVQGSCVTVIR